MPGFSHWQTRDHKVHPRERSPWLHWQGWAVPAEFSTPGHSTPVPQCPSSYLSKFLREKEHAETSRTGSTESHSKLLLAVLFLGFPSNETKGFSCFQTAFENIFSHFISFSSPEKLSKTSKWNKNTLSPQMNLEVFNSTELARMKPGNIFWERNVLAVWLVP